ncbi:MAG: ABC transporter substrate-binding protein [Propionibacteriaceae bacterium]
MKAYTKGALATVAALTLTLSACGGGNKAGNDASGKEKVSNKAALVSWNPQPREKLQDGGNLTTSITQIPINFNSWSASSDAYTGTIAGWYNPSFSYFTPEGEYKVDKNYFVEEPKEEIKDGKTVITYKMHPKAVFNDGTPIDITAFEAAWKACGEVTPADYSCNSTDGYNKIESIKAGADNKEIIVTFKQIFPWYQSVFGGVLHPKALDKDVFATGFENNPHPEWGAGPFKIEKMDAKEGIATFVPNEKWWGDAPKLSKRTFLVRSSNAEIQAFLNGEIDVADAGTKDKLAKIKDMQGIEVRRGNEPSSRLLTLNSSSSFLGDVKVREAIVRSIDRKVYADIIFQGLDYTEDPSGSFVLYPWQKGYKDSFSEIAKFDPEQSNKLLEGAGWIKSGDYRTKDGKTLELTLPYFGDSPVVKARSVAVQEMLKKIGIKLNLENPPSSDFNKVINEKKWDLMLSGFQSGSPYGVAFFCQIYCTTETSGSTLNKSGTGTKELDAKIKEMEKLTSRDEQIARANELEGEMLKTFGIMPIANGPVIYASKKGLANQGASVFGSVPIQDIGWEKTAN